MQEKEDKLFDVRIGAFKQQNWQDYQKCIDIIENTRKTLVSVRMATALKHIQCEPQVYQQALAQMMGDPQMMIAVEQHDMELALNRHTKILFQTRDEFKNVWLDRINIDFEAQKKMLDDHSLDGHLPKKLMKTQEIRTLDTIFVKYGFTLGDLQKAQKLYSL